MKKIKEVSQLVGVSRRTLQYYDDEGIFSTKRERNNHRVYDQYALERIWQVLIYKEMNFELKEIKRLLTLTNDQKNIVYTDQIEAIKQQITVLKGRMRLISFVQMNGLPSKPEEHSGKTYVGYIKEMRQKMQGDCTKGEKTDESKKNRTGGM